MKIAAILVSELSKRVFDEGALLGLKFIGGYVPEEWGKWTTRALFIKG